MAVAVAGFNGKRLTQARKARGLTAVSLAEMVDVSQTTISLYEKGTQKPRQEILDRLSRVLNRPTSYFLSEIPITPPTKLFYRSMSSATKSARARVEARYESMLELIEYLQDYFDYPELTLPEFDLPDDFRTMDSLTIEAVADEVRKHWLLAVGPIDNMVRTLESNGIIVWKTLFEAETLDAFSEIRAPHPIVVLSEDKESFFRSRFNAAHELGHLVLHRHVDRKCLNKSSDFKLIENQAHHFSGAFLLPATSYSKELWDTSLDAFRSLKPRWGAAIALQIMRCRKLGMLTEAEEKRLWINLSRRGWRKREPLDDSTPVETPNLIQKSLKLLLSEGVRSAEQIASDLNLHPSELERLCGMEDGFLTGRPRLSDSPRLKHSEPNVVPFKR